MRLRRKIGVAVSTVMAAGIAAVVLPAAITGYPLEDAVPIADPGVWRGAWHVHTTLSDGLGSVEEVASAAKRAGAGWVVFADHNKMIADGPRYLDGVLLVPSTEVSSQEGHVVGLGVSRALTDEERRGRPLDAIRELGGAAIAAHPLNRKRPYTAIDDRRLVGMEILSADDLFRDAMAAPWIIAPALLAYPVNQEHAALKLMARPAANLERWDALTRERPLAGHCSIDAHGYPKYEVMMRVIASYAVVGTPASGDARRDAAALTAALVAGRNFCGVDSHASAAGFRFEALAAGDKVAMGGEVPLTAAPELTVRLMYDRVPAEARPRLVCDGKKVDLVARPAVDGERSWTYLPVAPGACRAEVALGDGPSARAWILSNPIYVR